MSDPIPEIDLGADEPDHHAATRVGALDPGETLEGALFASRQISAFKGDSVVLGVTDRRLLIQPLDRRGQAKGERISILPEDIRDIDGRPAGGGWMTLEASIMDQHAVRLRIDTTDGQKQKLMLMRGGGGLFGKLGGGEAQQRGVEALGQWLARREAGELT